MQKVIGTILKDEALHSLALRGICSTAGWS